VLPVTESADDCVIDFADANMVDRRHRDGLVGTVTVQTLVGSPMLGTDASGHGNAGRDGSVSRCGWGQQTSLRVDPDQVPRRIGEPEAATILDRGRRQDAQRVPERILDVPDGAERLAGDEDQPLGTPAM
jgi:hypothetical protein